MSVAVGVVIILIGTVLFMVITAGAISLMMRSRDRNGSSGAMRPALLEIEALIDPSKRHTLRVARGDDAQEEPGSGDPPRRS